jgi:hypothetical protein
LHNNQYKFATHCKHGHPLAGANLQFSGRGHRVCRTCSIARRKEWGRRQRNGR